jgi:hypothetical protein
MVNGLLNYEEIKIHVLLFICFQRNLSLMKQIKHITCESKKETHKSYIHTMLYSRFICNFELVIFIRLQIENNSTIFQEIRNYLNSRWC